MSRTEPSCGGLVSRDMRRGGSGRAEGSITKHSGRDPTSTPVGNAGLPQRGLRRKEGNHCIVEARQNPLGLPGGGCFPSPTMPCPAYVPPSVLVPGARCRPLRSHRVGGSTSEALLWRPTLIEALPSCGGRRTLARTQKGLVSKRSSRPTVPSLCPPPPSRWEPPPCATA